MIIRIYDFIRINIPLFFKNIWRFRKQLVTHQWWDYTYTLSLMKRSLELTKEGLEKHGNEVIEIRGKKIEKIDRAIYLIGLFMNEDFEELARIDLKIDKMPVHSLVKLSDGRYELKTDNEEDWNKISKRANKIKDESWEELWSIFKGTKKLDGTDLRGWWD